MDVVSSEAQTITLFSAVITGPDGLADLGSDVWPLARLSASGGCGLENLLAAAKAGKK